MSASTQTKSARRPKTNGQPVGFQVRPSETNGPATIYVRQDDPFHSLNSGSTATATKVRPSISNHPFGDVKINVKINGKTAARETVQTEDAGTRLDAELERISQIANQLSSCLAEPTAPPVVQLVKSPEPALGPVDTAVVARSRKSARDAWCAVVLMGLFIVGGFAWTTGSLATAQTQIDTLTQKVMQLTQALTAEHSSAVSLKQENNKLYKQLAGAQHDASAVRSE